MGAVDGIRLRLRFDATITTIVAPAPDDRFALRIVPSGSGEAFETRFAVHATPLDLPRFILDATVRTTLLAIRPRPTIELVPPTLTLEVDGFLDAEPLVAAIEVTARLARLLAERAAMCARP